MHWARWYRRYQTQDEYWKKQVRRYQRRRARARRGMIALALIFASAGLGMVGYSIVLGEDSLVPRAISTATKGDEFAASSPKDTTLWLTVPKMARVEDLPVYDAAWDDKTALDFSAQHVQETGFPWQQEEANVYIAGHRMGFPGTRSFLVFYDLDVLENGDEVLLTDADGTRYTYEVFEQFVTDPFDIGPMEAALGKSIVTLQSCTLPDYSRRLLVQAELAEVTPGTDST